MLNRRHLRVKVLQSLYSFNQSENKDVSFFESGLISNINKVYDMYILLLNLIPELAQFTETDAKERAAKHVKNPDDWNISTRFTDNKLAQLIAHHAELKKEYTVRKITWQGERELIKSLFNEFKNSEEYKTYVVAEQNFSTDKEFILWVVKNIFTNSIVLEQYLEEISINWPVDKSVVYGMLIRTIKSASETKLNLELISQNWPEDREYILKLFREIILRDAEFQGYISKRTKNWDVERIALMDVLLMKMAICEWLIFNEIPVKVSINEYIDISKEFSTPKSKSFINGVLDKILDDLKTQNLIHKTGRGLLEN